MGNEMSSVFYIFLKTYARRLFLPAGIRLFYYGTYPTSLFNQDAADEAFH